MKLEELRELINLMRENQIAEIDLEEEGKRVRVVAMQAPQAAPQGFAPVQYIQAAPAPAALPAAPAADAPPPPHPEEEGAVKIKSPLVGTFYRSPMPDSPSYVDIGAEIEEESVLCIVEAMKVMNEIKAEIKGRILKILVENGHPVEFGQPLFLVAPAG